MATFGINEADNYGGNGAGYFNLKDDGDSAIVRFMYNTLDDITGYAVHNIELGNNRHLYVSCLREDYNEPLDNCPLCAAKNFQQAKFYFNLFDCETEEVKLWERGKQILKKLVSVLNQIEGPICGTPIKIIRKGEAGDRYTTYEFELMQPDGVTLEDLPESIDPMENVILSYTVEELNNYVKTGRLPGLEMAGGNDNNSNNYTATSNTDHRIIRRYTSPNRGTTGNGSSAV